MFTQPGVSRTSWNDLIQIFILDFFVQILSKNMRTPSLHNQDQRAYVPYSPQQPNSGSTEGAHYTKGRIGYANPTRCMRKLDQAKPEPVF